MPEQNVEQQSRERRGNRCWYIFALGLALVSLLAGAWFSVAGAGASASPGGKQGAQPILPVPLPGMGAGPVVTGPAPAQAPPASSGKGQPGGLPPEFGDGSAGTGGSPLGEAPAAPDCSPDWVVVSSPNGAFHSTVLYAVDDIAPNDVWAGGLYENNATPPQDLPYLEHWNGTSWTAASVPLPAGGVSGRIQSISANTSSDVWAVGYYSDGTNTYVLIERWGGIQWNVVIGVNPSVTNNRLAGVAAISANNAWAVGYYVGGGLQRTLIERWNGTNWLPVLSPNHGTGDNSLADISAIPGSGGSDMWAVGYYYPTPASQSQTLTLHYDGTTWSYVASPNQGGVANTLNGVSALAADDVWAVGNSGGGFSSHTLVERWNGTSWSILSAVDPDTHGNVFERVYAKASNDVWAAGYTRTSLTVGTQLVEHWNGSAWTVSSNTPVGTLSAAFGISGSSGSDVWAVGGYVTSTGAPAESLAMHYNGSSWSVVRSADGPSTVNVLWSADADSVNSVWAVGLSVATVGGTGVTNGLIERWNGSSWDIVPSPHPGPNTDGLFGLEVISSNDIWAVGSYVNAGGFHQTLIEHWSGTIWTVVSSPNPGGVNHDNALMSVSGASANDVWAVGSYFTGALTRSLVLHWNGVAWTQFASPSPGAFDNVLDSVAVVPGSGGTDVWAGGSYKNAPADHYSTLFERWDGTNWSVVSSPNTAGVDNEISRVFATAANDVWAAGFTSSAVLFQNLVLHWNGSAWATSPVLQNGTHSNQLLGVTATAANDAYVVGTYADSGGLAHPLVEHWNGSAWSILPSVTTAGLEAAFTDMVMLSSTNMWAVGFYVPAGFTTPQTLVEHYNPCPTSCTITFSDVPPGSTFYPYIHCMACLGIINGYPDGTFKPNANVTRGQLSKIVANSAGFHDAQTVRMFQDVPLGSTFQVYIGRLASRGYISGYPCGGTNEPCVPPGNLPYFRPNNNATRGQISKIVSNAAGFADAPSGQQFQDVAPASTYYAYIYRLVTRGVMSGYPCGGAGEPCVPPGNLPYFRSNNNATRGQTSKIVGNTFYPDCSFLGAGKR